MALRHQSLTLSQKGGTAMNQVKTFSHPLFGLLNGQLEEALPKASYCDQVLASPSTFTMTEVAKDCSMTVHQLTQLLMRLRVIYRSPSAPYMLYAGYLHQGYESYRSRRGQDIFGNITWTDNYLVWTEKGRRFIHELINDFNQN